MEKQNLVNLFNEQIKQGAVVGNGTSYFVTSDPMPTEGNDTILATDDNTIKVEPSTSGKLVVYYKTKSGRWLSKNTLFGRHFASNPGKYKVTDLQSRTTLKDGIKSHVMPITVAGNLVNVYLFNEDTPVAFSKIAKCYLPIQTVGDKTAWDPTTRLMDTSREVTDYATLTVG